MATTTTTLLAGKKVLVLGGTGNVGWGITKAALEAGAKVYVPSRNAESLQSLKDEGVEKVKQLIGSNHVFSTLGSGEPTGKAPKFDAQEYIHAINNLTLPHFVAARNLLPWLQNEDASYTFITGGFGEGCHSMPDRSLTAMGASAQFGVANAFRAEFKDSKVRVNEHRILVGVRKDHAVEVGTNPSSKVGTGILKLATSGLKDKVARLTAENLAQHQNGNFQ